METNANCSSSCGSSSTSGLPSLSSAVSEPASHLNISRGRSVSPSLANYLRDSSTSTLLSCYSSCEEESDTSEESEEYSLADKVSQLLRGKSSRRDVNCDPLPPVDPAGWIKYSLDNDPWNEAYYLDDDHSEAEDGVLTHEMVQSGLSKMGQLPDTKQFVLTRLHIRNKKLTDAAVLSQYRYVQYVDMSFNSLTDLQALNSCYLLYLNASHNQLTQVLDMTPPSFLTHADLSYNRITEIGSQLHNFWSLCHLDLSHNLIEKIQGLADLKYLRYLNLAHNQIRCAEGLDCVNLEQLDLQSNLITDTEPTTDNPGFHTLRNIKELNVANNKLTSLLPFKDLYTIRRLDVSGNHVADLYEIDNLTGYMSLVEFNMSGNPVTTYQGYREYVLYKLPRLQCLDCVTVMCSERVAAKQLLRPDFVTKGDQLRAKVELWTQLAARVVDEGTMPVDQPPVPLVVLVGTFANGRDTVAKLLANKCQDRMYRCKKFTTMPTGNYYDPDNVVSVSVDQFNDMIRTGQLVVHYKELGVAFGVGREELCKCVIEGKVALIDTTLDAALAMRSLSLHPVLVLTVVQDSQNYADHLRKLYVRMNLWPKCHPDVVKDDRRTDPETSNENVEDLSWYTSDTFVTPPIPKSVSKYFVEQFPPRYTAHLSNKNTPSSPTDENITGPSYNLEGDFVWNWPMESSRESLDLEPRDSLLNMLRGREKLVQESLREQEAYVEIHNSMPGLFQESIHTDDVEKAVSKIGKTCLDIFNLRKTKDFMKGIMEDPDCKTFVEERVASLMRDLLNVSSEM